MTHRDDAVQAARAQLADVNTDSIPAARLCRIVELLYPATVGAFTAKVADRYEQQELAVVLDRIAAEAIGWSAQIRRDLDADS